MRNVTLLFLVRRDASGEISDICLAMKKRGFGVGRWNGVGGKVMDSETIEAAAARETMEEISVMPKNMRKVAVIDFHFKETPDWDQQGHIYLSDAWEGDPAESEEMRPRWFNTTDIPYDEMWSDDIFWLPTVLSGTKLRAAFTFGAADAILVKEVTAVESV